MALAADIPTLKPTAACAVHFYTAAVGKTTEGLSSCKRDHPVSSG